MLARYLTRDNQHPSIIARVASSIICLKSYGFLKKSEFSIHKCFFWVLFVEKITLSNFVDFCKIKCQNLDVLHATNRTVMLLFVV